ncbi:O-antigen ligase [Branchiibius hedensis]|uniref:O-antigen ligase n=1 Tax=Branchiibius hedensis TaxID=672460 RepID=A0A2Y8ZSL4_9MICO|nr:O-antigen ligase family protein [Branchiibius hedensis]PWJ26142.1 O-antigen ligase [Branchiibius hedensis]SSA34954.1 O-antigen ligase [Branchiibius hedensis]
MTTFVRTRGGAFVAAALAVAVAVLAGLHVGQRPGLVLGLTAGLLVFLIGVSDPGLLALVCCPAFLMVMRTSVAGTDLAISDLAITVCALTALVSGPRPFSPPMRSLLWLCVGYQAALTITLIATPYRANFIEWGHEWMLAAGALIVGWTLAASGRANAACNVLLTCGGLIALGVIGQGLWQFAHGDYSAVYLAGPFPMHKNLAGTILAFLALLAYARPLWLRVPTNLLRLSFGLMLIALLFTQARQGIVALMVGMLVLLWLRPKEQRRSTVIVVLAIPVAGFIWWATQQQLADPSDFSSANIRISSWKTSIDIWQLNPWFGQGLRWWYRPDFPGIIAPPNGLTEMLTSAGIIGVAAYLVLFGGALWVLAQVPRRYSALAIAVLVAHLLRGQLDMFWLAVVASLPWLLIGICLGAQRWENPEDTAPTTQRRPAEVGV